MTAIQDDNEEAAMSPSALPKFRATLERLSAELNAAQEAADQSKAGMREVALMRAANAKACMGDLAWPLLLLAESLAAAYGNGTDRCEFCGEAAPEDQFHPYWHNEGAPMLACDDCIAADAKRLAEPDASGSEVGR